MKKKGDSGGVGVGNSSGGNRSRSNNNNNNNGKSASGPIVVPAPARGAGAGASTSSSSDGGRGGGGGGNTSSSGTELVSSSARGNGSFSSFNSLTDEATSAEFEAETAAQSAAKKKGGGGGGGGGGKNSSNNGGAGGGSGKKNRNGYHGTGRGTSGSGSHYKKARPSPLIDCCDVKSQQRALLSAQGAAHDCLETSLTLLHASVEHAKESAGTCLEKSQRGDWCVTATTTASSSVASTAAATADGEKAAMAKNGDGTKGAAAAPALPDPAGASGTGSPKQHQWWMSLFQRLQESHQSEKEQLQSDLKSAKTQGDKLKRELRTHMEDRLQWLEERLENDADGNGNAVVSQSSNDDNSRRGGGDGQQHQQKQHPGGRDGVTGGGRRGGGGGGGRNSGGEEETDYSTGVDEDYEKESRQGSGGESSPQNSSTDEDGYEVDDEYSNRNGGNNKIRVPPPQPRPERPGGDCAREGEVGGGIGGGREGGDEVLGMGRTRSLDPDEGEENADQNKLQHQHPSGTKFSSDVLSTSTHFGSMGVTSDLTEAEDSAAHGVYHSRSGGQQHHHHHQERHPRGTNPSTSGGGGAKTVSAAVAVVPTSRDGMLTYDLTNVSATPLASTMPPINNLGTVRYLGSSMNPIDGVDDAAGGYGTETSATDSCVEIRYDNAMILQRLNELESAVQVHEREKTLALEQANRVKEQGEQLTELSETMQEQLIQLMREVETASWKQTKKWKEKVGVQKQLLELLEQQHVASVEEWTHQKDVYENTLAQLAADKFQLEQELHKEKKRNPQEESKKWQREREVYENTVAQLTADKMDLRDRLKRARGTGGGGGDDDDEVEGRGAGGVIVLSTPPASPMKSCLKKPSPLSSSNKPMLVSSPRRVEWEDKLDRAIVERDMYKHENETLKKALEEANKENNQNDGEDGGGDVVVNIGDATATADTEALLRAKQEEWKVETELKLAELRDEYAEKIETLEQLVEAAGVVAGQNGLPDVATMAAKPLASPSIRKASSDIGEYSESNERQLREDAQHLLRTKEKQWKQETERQLKVLRDEYTEVIEDLEQQLDGGKDSDTRYRESVEKRNALVSKMRALEQKRDEEKGEWKLRLEAALASTRTVEEAKDSIEREYQQAKEAWMKEKDYLTEQLEAAQDKCHQAALEVTKLEQVGSDMERNQEKIQELSDQRENLELELKEIQELLSRQAGESRDRIEELSLKHAREVDELKEELEASKSETLVLIDKTNELVHSLEDLKNSHRNAKEKWEHQLQSVITEKDNQIFKLKLQVGNSEQKLKLESESRSPLEKVQSAVCRAVEELRKDVVAVRETLETSTKADSSIASANHAELSENMNAMQAGLNEAIAELTLGTEAMIEVKENLVDKTSQQSLMGVSEGPGSEIRSVVKEIGELRKQLVSFVEARQSTSEASAVSAETVSVIQDSMRKELLEELQKKEKELAALKGELEHVKAELVTEQAKLQGAESEIIALNDQADAYSDELMRMQALNAGMEETLKATERNMEAVLHRAATRRPNDDDPPSLEEALALAKGLTNLVHGDEDADVMDMLRSMSDLMDRQENQRVPVEEADGHWPTPAPTDELDDDEDHLSELETIQSPRSAFLRGDSSIVSERPPAPIETPERSSGSKAGSNGDGLFSPSRTSLQTIVEQLYSRCQLLERERTQMMETTLDLLTSARQANAAELEAALSTARRKAMEEVTRVHQQTQLEKERLYRKLCGGCVKGLSLSSSSSAAAIGSIGSSSATAVTAASTMASTL